MWEILGWVSAGWLILIVSALAVALLVSIVRGIKTPVKPRSKEDQHVTIFRGGDETDPAEVGRRISEGFRRVGGI